MQTLSLSLPRERLSQYGVESLSIYELIALILRTGTPGRDAKALAEDVVAQLQSGCTSLNQLSAITGIGLSKAASLVAALALPEKIALQNPPSPNAASLAGLCGDLLHMPQEHVALFSLTVHGSIITRSLISLGTVSASLSHPREVFRPAIEAAASGVVLVHTHPSGSPLPSPADSQVTSRLAAAGSILGIPLLDHIICAKNGYYSFREQLPKLLFTQEVC